MSITLLYGCCHIELSVRDLATSRAFLEQVLGAAPIEQQFASDLRALVPDDYGIDHFDCGRATFQLNQPSAWMAENGHSSVFQDYLDEVGPCVTDLNFYVDDIVHAHELLGGLGAETLMQGPSTLVESLSDYGPDNTRPGGDGRPFLFLGARHLMGFDLEIMEPNFVRFVDQTAQRPCFVGADATSDAEGLRLRRLRVAVRDLEATYANLVEILTPGSRTLPYAVRRGALATAFRMTMGGLELEYCQPLGPDSALSELLERHGPGVVTAHFSAPSIAEVLARVQPDESLLVTDDIDLLGDGAPRSGARITSRELVGFDVVLEELDQYLVATGG